MNVPLRRRRKVETAARDWAIQAVQYLRIHVAIDDELRRMLERRLADLDQPLDHLEIIVDDPTSANLRLKTDGDGLLRLADYTRHGTLSRRAADATADLASLGPRPAARRLLGRR